MKNKAFKLALILCAFVSCNTEEDNPCGNVQSVGGFIDDLLFPVSNDVKLGNQVAADISSSGEYRILPEKSHEQAYSYLNSIKESILNSGKIVYKDRFLWKLYIIDDDVLNAFATPGGHIYVYTGLIKYLDDVDHLAGVMGHELAHADRRHATNQLKKQLGVTILVQAVLGEESEIIQQVISSLLSLKFSRDNEADADANAVIYHTNTGFSCNGVAGFFEKLETEGSGSGIPEFLSTHPTPKNRVTDINQRSECMGCLSQPSDKIINGLTYDQFKALL